MPSKNPRYASLSFKSTDSAVIYSNLCSHFLYFVIKDVHDKMGSAVLKNFQFVSLKIVQSVACFVRHKESSTLCAPDDSKHFTTAYKVLIEWHKLRIDADKPKPALLIRRAIVSSNT